MSKSSLVQCFGYCILYSIIYVGSLYLWRCKLPRDHPYVMKRRFCSVIVASIVILLIVSHEMGGHVSSQFPFLHINWELLYIRLDGLLPSIIIPIFLTAILFLGPSVGEYLDGYFPVYLSKFFWSTIFRDIYVTRNLLIAPITEEFVFRACIIYHLQQHMSGYTALFMSPLFFGVAHIHHFIERLRFGSTVVEALTTSLFQVAYTSVFGAYSGFIMLRTGHLISAILVHSYCNHMGFPNFGLVFHYTGWKSTLLMISYILGLVAFIFMLFPLTDPSFYHNHSYNMN